MFSGIVESTAEVVGLREDKENLHITMRAPFADELKIDQSVAHNASVLLSWIFRATIPIP